MRSYSIYNGAVFAVLSLLINSVFNNMAAHAKCQASCNYHGYCNMNDKCICYRGLDGYPAFTGHLCEDKTCARGLAWAGPVVGANDAHPLVECSNRGWCDRRFGVCMCQDNFGGIACERTVCLNDCTGNGECITQTQLAAQNDRTYSTPWDATKQVGCVCDIGFRGSDCSEAECPTGRDVLRGPGNESGRDCSGRGVCDYKKGVCDCFPGYHGPACDLQLEVLLE